MRRNAFLVRLVSFVVCLAFFWTNCVWAGGLALQQDKLAAPHQVPLVSEYLGELLRDSRIVDRLGIKDLGDIIENGQRLDKEGVIAFASLDEETRKWAKYIFGKEGVILRIAEDGVNDDFYKLLNKYTLLKEKDEDGEWIYIGEDPVVVNAVNNFLGNINSNWRISVSKGVVGGNIRIDPNGSGFYARELYKMMDEGQSIPQELKDRVENLHKKELDTISLDVGAFLSGSRDKYNERGKAEFFDGITTVVNIPSGHRMSEIFKQLVGKINEWQFANGFKEDNRLVATLKIGSEHISTYYGVAMDDWQDVYNNQLNSKTKKEIDARVAELKKIGYPEEDTKRMATYEVVARRFAEALGEFSVKRPPKFKPYKISAFPPSGGKKVLVMSVVPASAEDLAILTKMQDKVQKKTGIRNFRDFKGHITLGYSVNDIECDSLKPLIEKLNQILDGIQDDKGYEYEMGEIELLYFTDMESSLDLGSFSWTDLGHNNGVGRGIRAVKLPIFRGQKYLVDLAKATRSLYEFFLYPDKDISKEIEEILSTISIHLKDLNLNIDEKEIDTVIDGIRQEVEDIRRDVDYREDRKNRVKYLKKFRGELAPIVDKTDKEIVAVTEIGLAHIFGLRHRTANAFVIAPNGKIILQRRAPGRSYEKYLSIFRGHIKFPESYEEGMKDELRGELGLSSTPEGRLVELGKDLYEVGGDTNREWRTYFAYFLTPEEYGKIKAKSEELEKQKGQMSEEGFTERLVDEAAAEPGKGEVWGYYERDLEDVLNAPKEEVDVKELKRKIELRYLPLTDYFADGKILQCNAPFTPDLLERIVNDDKLIDKLAESICIEECINRAINMANILNRDVPPSIVDINKYVGAERFVDRWFFYELPAEVFVQDFFGGFLTDEEKMLQGRFFNIGTSRVPGQTVKIKDFLSTNEMEALFLDITRAILGKERFNEIIAEVEKWNKGLDEKASQVYDRLASDNRVPTWKEKIKASILSEFIAGGEDEYFKKQMESDESIKVDDSDKFIQQLEKLTGSTGGHYLHVASHHGAIIFDLKIFALDIIKEWLGKNIKGFNNIDWNDTRAVKNKLAEVQSQIESRFCVTFAVKDKRIAPTDVTVEDIGEILKGERFGLLRVFMECGLFSIVNTRSQTRGMNLNDASEEFIKVLEEATLIGIKGGDNTITARLLNKDHFVFGTAIGYGIQRYTGLRFRREAGQIPAGYMAFIPAGIPATCEVQFSVPPRQNLGQFVIARKKLEESGISYDLVKERMDRGDTFVEAVYPEILGDTDEARKALRTIRDLADNGGIPFNEAIETYVEKHAPQDIKSAMFDYTVLELNRAFNERIVKGIFPEGSYQRASYVLREKKGDKPGEYIGEKISTRDAYQKAGKNRVLVNVLKISKEAFSKGLFELGGVQASDHSLGLIAPEKVAEDEFKNRDGIIINFLYFFTDRLRKEFNMRSRQVELEDKPFITGSYIGFQKDRKTGEVFAPLYNKGAIAVFKDGRIEFGRVRLGTGSLVIGGKKISWVPFDKVQEGTNPEAIAYTPMFDQNLKENGVTHFGTSYDERDKETAKTGKATRRILTPPAEGRVSIVIFRNRIIQIREGQAEIPPAGWVLSVKKDIFDEIKGGLGTTLIPKKDKSGSEYFVLADGVALEFDYDLPEGWEDAYWIMGGATLTYNHKDGRIPISKVMDIEGWNYNSSRQTQETDLSMVDSRGPRQVICQTMDGDFCIFTFSGRSDMSGGVTHDEALDVIINELKKDGKELAYALNLDGGSSVCMGVAKEGEFYPINITGKGDNGTCDVRPVNGVAFIRSILKASSLSKRVVEGKKETVYSSIKVDIFGNILGVEELVKDSGVDIEAIKGLLAYLKENFGEGVFGPVREIVIVDNLGGIDSEIPLEQRGGAAYFVGQKMVIDIDVFRNPTALRDVGAHENFEATLRLVEANPGIQEVAATYCSLETLLELTPEELDSYIEFLKQPDNGLDSGDYAELLEVIKERKDKLTGEDLIALSLGCVLNTPRYEHLKDSLAGVMAGDIENAREKLELAKGIYKDIVEAKKEVNELKKIVHPVIEQTRFAKAKVKVRMVISSLPVIEAGFIDALLENNKYIMLDRDELAKPENKRMKDWVEGMVKGRDKSPFIYSDEEIPEGADIIHLMEPDRVNDRLPKDRLYLPLPYSISSIYLASQVVLAEGKVSGIGDRLVLNTIRALYETLLGRDVADAELEQLFRMPWTVLPPVAQISATLNVLRKAITQIEKAA